MDLCPLKEAAVSAERVVTPAAVFICLGSLALESTTGVVTIISAPFALAGAGYRLWKSRTSE
jgi:hypothetical protein